MPLVAFLNLSFVLLSLVVLPAATNEVTLRRVPGGGIQPEILQRLFQPGTSTKGEGHEGIGLAVSDSIVRRMGGRILCRSSLGRGTIFVVLLPRKVARAGAPESDTTGVASSHSMDPRIN